MKFRTQIEKYSFATQIGYQEHLLSLGSCFAEQIAQRLAEAKFRIVSNPTGILFNPLSIAEAIRSYATPVQQEELHHEAERWFHYAFHGSFSAPTAEEALLRMNTARRVGAEALRRADVVLITFGTAWVYEREGSVVANCHRQPATEFTRRRLSVEEIVACYEELLRTDLAGKRVILTVSPVRHIGDTLSGNSVSKATLRLAAEHLAEKVEAVEYYPSYEIVTDDLRDYRFYADDLAHPSPQAVAYIWEHFSQALLSPRAQALLPEVEAICQAAAHRPLNPQSDAHRALCQKMLARIDALPEVDFHTEAAFFRQSLK